MQVQLKQVEIEMALKAYITNLGIDLSNKTVTIVFTSGRRDNGLSADIEFVENKTIPGFTDATPMRVVPPAGPQQEQHAAADAPEQQQGAEDPTPSGKVSLFNKPA